MELSDAFPQIDHTDFLSTRAHEKFPYTCNTDLVIRASDNVLFYLHKKYLEAHTGAFPGEDLPSPVAQADVEDITCLTEPGRVLAVVFGFVYPRKHPDLQKIDFDTVLAVAEAVEKYEVFSAMTACNYRLRDFIKTHPQQLLTHAIKHGHLDLVDKVVPYLARKPLREMFETLPDNLARAWGRYHEKWEHVFWAALKHIRQEGMSLSEVDNVLAWREIPDLIKLQDALDPGSGCSKKCSRCSREQSYCQGCRNYSTYGCQPKFGNNTYLRSLAELCRKEIAAIPPFTSFLQ